jgi:hypothetical protein
MEVKMADSFFESLERMANRERWYWKTWDFVRYDFPKFGLPADGIALI